MFEMEEVHDQTAKIKVVGVGGAGGNVINNMVASNISEVEFISINTDVQVLSSSLALRKVQIGKALTKGLGTGSKPDLGRQSALEDRTQIANCLEGADMVFITAGMGGGTGTGAAPVIAEVAREMGALTVAIVTKPFFYEGRHRLKNAEEGIEALRKHVDSILIVPNDRIGLVVEKNTSLLESFSVANDVLRQAVTGISDLILIPGLINLDFADVRTVMENSGRSVMGLGTAEGENAAKEAATKAITNQLLEDSSIDGADRIVVNVTGGLELSLKDVHDATVIVKEKAKVDANILVGAVVDPDIKDLTKVTVIATGFAPDRQTVEMSKLRMELPNRKKLKPEGYKGAERVLAKTLSPAREPERVELEGIVIEDPMDVPAFMRKPVQKSL